jgi:hypothetical protein
MGAQQFWALGRGANASKAFSAAVDAARHAHGHGGYTGSIAEKSDGFTVIRAPAVEAIHVDDRRGRMTAARRLADEMFEADDPRIDDKWGPAGCIDIGAGEFLFFGWASS